MMHLKPAGRVSVKKKKNLMPVEINEMTDPKTPQQDNHGPWDKTELESQKVSKDKSQKTSFHWRSDFTKPNLSVKGNFVVNEY